MRQCGILRKYARRRCQVAASQNRRHLRKCKPRLKFSLVSMETTNTTNELGVSRYAAVLSFSPRSLPASRGVLLHRTARCPLAGIHTGRTCVSVFSSRDNTIPPGRQQQSEKRRCKEEAFGPPKLHKHQSDNTAMHRRGWFGVGSRGRPYLARFDGPRPTTCTTIPSTKSCEQVGRWYQGVAQVFFATTLNTTT